MKSISHYINTLSGISLKIGIREYYLLKRKFGIYAASELSADVLKIPKDREKEFYQKVIAFLLNHNRELQERFLRLVLAVRSNCWENASKEDYLALQSVIENLSWKQYSPERWKSISAFLISNGLFVLGEICREKARDAVLKRKNRIGDHWRKAIWYLEENNLPHAKIEIDKFSASCFMKKYRKSDIGCAKIYYNILSGSTPEGKAGKGKDGASALYDVAEYAPADVREKNFHTYVKGQDFLIIGPAPRKEPLAWKTEGLKIVRSNDRGESHGTDPETALSYYNGPGTKWICEHGGEEFTQRLDFAVVKHACRDLDVSNMHRVGDFNCILPAGHLNMLPVMIVDLNYNEAGKIYVCGNNLFFSKNPWEKGYQSAQSDWNRTNFWPGLCNHEIYSQFHLLQNTYEANAFIADAELEHVLRMTVRQYAEGMEKIYSIPD